MGMMPELPKAAKRIGEDYGDSVFNVHTVSTDYYTAAQMHAAYAEGYAAAQTPTGSGGGVEAWETQSMKYLAKGLRARGDDLSTDAASWLEKFAAQAQPRSEGVVMELEALRNLYAQEEHSDEPPTEHDLGYEQACAEFVQHLDSITAALATLARHTAAQDAEIAEAREGWHMANDVAALAMKHRDAAEADNARLREALAACIDYGNMTGDEWVIEKARAALEQTK